jgi:hypothetical protein
MHIGEALDTGASGPLCGLGHFVRRESGIGDLDVLYILTTSHADSTLVKVQLVDQKMTKRPDLVGKLVLQALDVAERW